MKGLRVCANCCKTLRLDSDIGLAVYRAGEFGRDFLYVLDLIVPESPVGFHLFSRFYRVSYREKMFEAEIQGRKMDAEEDAFFEEADRLRKDEKWRRGKADELKCYFFLSAPQCWHLTDVAGINEPQ